MVEPAASRSSADIPRTVACVPTGMKTGVRTCPCGVSKRAARARDPLARASTRNRRRIISCSRCGRDIAGRRRTLDYAMTLLLSCQDLTKAYGAAPLFADVSFGIHYGDRVGLVGPSGSGKSTLLDR